MKVAELKEELAARDEPEGLRQQGVAAPATARSDRAGPSCGAGRGGELGGSKGGAFTFLLYLARSEFRWEGGQLLAFCSEFVRRTLLAFCSKIAPLLAYPHPMRGVHTNKCVNAWPRSGVNAPGVNAGNQVLTQC